MGLDISVYTNLEFVTSDRERDPEHEMIHIYVNQDFPHHADNLKEGIYNGECSMGFRAGSYSGYGDFREELARLVGVTCKDVWNGGDGADDTPFFHLINFSDCEGVIGPDTSKKLAKEFHEHYENAKEKMGRYDLESYQNWMKAFDLASENNGAVCFH